MKKVLLSITALALASGMPLAAQTPHFGLGVIVGTLL